MGWIILLSIIIVIICFIYNRKMEQIFKNYVSTTINFLSSIMKDAQGVDYVPDRVQVAAQKQLLYENVGYFSRTVVHKEFAPDQIMEILDTTMLEDWDLIMVERHVSYSMVLEILTAEEISSDHFNEKEITNLLPVLFCEKVDLYVVKEDDGIVYVPDYKAPTTIIEFDEGDVEDDIYE